MNFIRKQGRSYWIAYFWSNYSFEGASSILILEFFRNKHQNPNKCVFIWNCDSFEVRNERKRWRRIVNIRIHLMTQCVRIYVWTVKVNTPSNAKQHTIERQINDSSDEFSRNECSNCLIRRTITKHFGARFFLWYEIYLESEINKPLKSCINKTELQIMIVSI